MTFDLSGKSIFVAGHRGMVGGALVRKLQERGDVELVLASREALDLSNRHAVHQFFDQHRPDDHRAFAGDTVGV